jgi:hypothetical protein
VGWKKRSGRRVEEERWKVEVGEERKRKREEEEEVSIYTKRRSDAAVERNKVAQDLRNLVFSSEAESRKAE